MEDSTLLHRQVHPNFVQNNQVSSQAFEGDMKPGTQVTSAVFSPSPKDNNKLSVYNGQKYSPEDSYNHFTKEFTSAGVVSVTVNECALPCIEDNLPFSGHTYVDFTGLTKGEIKAKAKVLKSIANKRGWTFKK
jgi:hypothetical protein